MSASQQIVAKGEIVSDAAKGYAMTDWLLPAVDRFGTPVRNLVEAKKL